jgi:hypothetical protein
MPCAARPLLVGGVSLAIWATAAGLATSAASAQERISAAETLLFQTDHLKNVAPPATLAYAFSKSGSEETGFDDTVELRIRSVDGAKRVSVAFFSAERNIAFPEVTGAEGNPVLLSFLERDIHEMQRLTGGKSGYFRKAIRLALARSASVAKTRLSYAGRELAAKEITITPYVADPLKDRIGRYASKTYVFTLSAAVPGGVYGVRSFVPSPAATPNEAPLLEERLRFVRIAKGV